MVILELSKVFVSKIMIIHYLKYYMGIINVYHISVYVC